LKKDLSDCIIKVSNYLGSACIIVMMLMITIEVVMRTLFHKSLLVVDEYSGYLMVISVFWGLSVAFRSNNFVKVDAFFNRLNPKARDALERIYYILLIIYNYYLLYYFFLGTQKMWVYKSFSSTLVRTPLYIPYGISLIGLITFELYLILSFVDLFFTKEGENK
jgi:TRAP-type C4-dicarboxylate transport system permease small subunit